MWKCRRVDSPDVRVPQTERQRLSGVMLASVCTYSVSPFLCASVLKHCLSLASLVPLVLLLFLSLCPSSFFLPLLFFYREVFILSFSFHLLIYFSMLSLSLNCFCFYTHLFLYPSLIHFLIYNSTHYCVFSPPDLQVFCDLMAELQLHVLQVIWSRTA
jgi:hypothetical protein